MDDRSSVDSWSEIYYCSVCVGCGACISVSGVKLKQRHGTSSLESSIKEVILCIEWRASMELEGSEDRATPRECDRRE